MSTLSTGINLNKPSTFGGLVENIQTNLIEGSVVFSDGTTLAEDNPNLFWDDTANALGIGTTTPESGESAKLSVVRTEAVSPGSGFVRGMRVFVQNTDTSGNAGSLSGGTLAVSLSSGADAGTLTGGTILAQNLSTGTVGNIVGLNVQSLNFSTGTATAQIAQFIRANNSGGTSNNLIGSFILVDQDFGAGGSSALSTGQRISLSNNNAASTMTEARGLSISDWANAGTVTTSYGIYLDSTIDIGTSAFAIVTEVGDIVFNESGGDFDLRVEGDADPNLFFVDASTNNIGIGTSTPAQKLNLSSTLESSVQFDNTTTGSAWRMGVGSGGSFLFAEVGGLGNHFRIFVGADRDLINLGTSGVILNEFAGDNDFRVEGVSEENVLFVDASANRVGIGTATPNADHHINGSQAINVTEIDNTDSPYTVLSGDYFIHADSSGGAITINLPTLVSSQGRVLVIKRNGASNVTIDGNASETIEGSTTLVMNIDSDSVSIVAKTGDWSAF